MHSFQLRMGLMSASLSCAPRSSSGDPVIGLKESVATSGTGTWMVCSVLLWHPKGCGSVIIPSFSESSLSQCLQVSSRQGRLDRASAFPCREPALCSTEKSYC